MSGRRIAVFGGVIGVLAVTAAIADDVAVRGRRMVVRENPAVGEASRRVVIVGREETSAPTVGPFTNGANMIVFVAGATPPSQLYFLEAAGWSVVPGGHRYVGPGPSGNPIEEVLVRVTAGQPARIRVVLRGDVGTKSLPFVPPDPGTGGGISLVGDGRTYCVQLGDAAGGTITANGARRFRIKGATSNLSCPPVPTPFPTATVQPCHTNCNVPPTPGPTSGGCMAVCAPTATPTPSPAPCPTPCPFTPSTPVVTPQQSPPFPTPTPTPCPTICS
jgi:hypothetical protein